VGTEQDKKQDGAVDAAVVRRLRDLAEVRQFVDTQFVRDFAGLLVALVVKLSALVAGQDTTQNALNSGLLVSTCACRSSWPARARSRWSLLGPAEASGLDSRDVEWRSRTSQVMRSCQLWRAASFSL
jgi:hypothetical protein